MQSLWIEFLVYFTGFTIGVLIIVCGMYLYHLADGRANKKSDWLEGLILVSTSIVCLQYGQAWYHTMRNWDSNTVVAEFAEWWIAGILNWGIPFIASVVGYISGHKLYKATSPKWIGWFVGVLVGIVIAFILYNISWDIPGIGWRMEYQREQ